MILLEPKQSLEILTTSTAKIDYNITVLNYDAQGNSTSWQPLQGSITTIGSHLITNNNSTIQQISLIALRNSSGSVSNTITISRVVGENSYPLTPSVTFAFGEFGEYNTSVGWVWSNAQGFTKFVGEQGPPGPDGIVTSIVAGTNVTVDSTDPANPIVSATAGATDWGDIGGTLSTQTDLQTALNLKAPIASPTFTGTVGGITKAMVGLSNVDNTSDANKPVSTAQQTALDLKLNIPTPIVGATKTKVTYDANGLIVSGVDATTADIADSTNRRYLTDAQLVVVGDTSGVNTGDQNLTPYFNKSVDDTDDITQGTNKFVTAADITKLSNTSGTNSGDNAVNALYSGLVSNATHTGDMDGATVITANKDLIANKSLVTAAVGDHVLIGDASDSDNLKKVTVQTIVDLASGGTPAGSTTQIQYNNAGVFAGDANFIWDATNKTLALIGPDTGINLVGITTEPSPPSANTLRFYSKAIAGRMFPKVIGPSGVDTPLQAALFQNRIMMYVPSTGTTGTGSGTGIGPVWTSGGTVSHPAPSSSAPAISNQMNRTRYANIATTTNQTLGIKAAAADSLKYWRGSAAGLGGFFYSARFIVELYAASTVRIFAGLAASSSTYVVASDTVINNTCGLWHDTTDPSSGAGAFNFVTRNTATTTKQPITLANAIVAGNSYDFYMWSAPNGSDIYWRLDDVVNGVTYSNSTSTTLPVNTAFMGPQCAMSNGTANITVTTVAIGVAGVYIESDR